MKVVPQSKWDVWLSLGKNLCPSHGSYFIQTDVSYHFHYCGKFHGRKLWFSKRLIFYVPSRTQHFHCLRKLNMVSVKPQLYLATLGEYLYIKTKTWLKNVKDNTKIVWKFLVPNIWNGSIPLTRNESFKGMDQTKSKLLTDYRLRKKLFWEKIKIEKNVNNYILFCIHLPPHYHNLLNNHIKNIQDISQ